ncbi:probable ubiquitin-conjugating enzyme E2 J2 at N-terminal half [Coccomyxa sp. Obi]|nr:probable ubiquitin-conjugating enzyme E2 J2 at N-terminal half [Coccomyxa sp. Obi]
MEKGKYNLRNPAVKRILQEIKELQKDPSNDFMAAALEDNIFEWHFAVRGPPDTEFQGGIYHGRILLPPEYPFKPPSFLMLSPTGRFETNVKICLSISSHHPEHWQPSWSVRTALTALIAFFPTPGNGAIGSLDWTKEERAAMALKSREQPPQFGGPERQAVTNEIHEAMLAAEVALAKPADEVEGKPAAEEVASAERAAESAQPSVPAAPALPPSPAPADQAGGKQVLPDVAASSSLEAPISAAVPDPVHAAPLQQLPQATFMQQTAVTASVADTAPAQQQHQTQVPQPQPQQHNSLLGEAVGAIAGDPPAGAPQSWEDRGLTVAAVALVVLIAAILFRRILVIAGADVTSLM